mgnify:CR=1 FL=1
MSVFNSINKLRSNIFGSRGVGKTTAISRQPGIQLADTSPTAILNKEPLDFSTLSYPRDLINDATNGHYMLFYINVQNKTKFPYTRAVDGVSVEKKKIEMRPVTETTATTTTYGAGTIKERKDTTYDVKTTYEEFASGGATNAVDIEQGFIDVDIDYSDVQLLRQDKTKMKTNLSDTDIMRNATVRIKESIAIYLPPNVQDNYATKYQGAETAILGFMAASGGKFLDAYRQNDFTKAAEILKDTAGGAFTEMGKRAAAAALDIVTGSEGAL